MFWPKYEEKSKIKIYLTQFIAGVYSLKFWIDFLKVLAIYAIYIGVIFFVPLPFTDKTISAGVIESWWLLDFFDKYFTGGGLSNASIFSLGILAILPFNLRFAIKRDFQLVKNITKTEIFFIALFSVFIVVWFIRNGILELKPQHIVISISLIILGSLIIRFLEVKLNSLEFGGIANLFIIIIIFKFINENIHDKNYLRPLFIAGFLILTLVVRLYLLRKKHFMEIWNVSGKDFERSEFPIPFIEDKMTDLALVSIALDTLLVFSFLNLFRITIISLTSNTWLNFLVPITIFVLVYLFFSIPNPMISRFNPDGISNDLKSDYWTFAEIRPGKETSILLSSLYTKLLTRSFIYVFFTLVSIFIACFLYSFFIKESYLFRYGQLGLIFLLIHLCGSLSSVYNKIMKYGKRRLSKYEWKYGVSAGRMLEILNPTAKQVPINIEEFILPFIDPKHVEKVRDLLAKCESKIDLAKILPLIIKYMEVECEQLSLSKVILSFLKIFSIVLIFSIFLFSIIAILMKVFNPTMHLSTNEYFFLINSFMFFWIGTSFATFLYCHPNLIKNIKRKAKERKTKKRKD